MTGTLRGRVALATAALVAVAVLATGAILSEGFAATERADLDDRLAERAAEAVDLTDRGRGRMAEGHPGGAVGRLGRLVDGEPELLRVLEDGEVVYEAGSALGASLPPPEGSGLAELTDAQDRPWRSYTVRDDGRAVQVAAPLALLEERLATLRRGTLLVGALAVALAGGAAWALSGLALAPLARLRDTAGHVAETGDLTERVGAAPGDPAEVRAVGEALDAMLARLEQAHAATVEALDSARRFAADAGHELRTPLTSLGANLEVVARNPDLDEAQRADALTAASAEQRRLVRLLDALQALARADAATAGEDVDLAEVADAATATAAERHPAAAFSLEGVEHAPVRASADGLRIAVDNLLANAVVHGGSHVAVRLGAEPGWVSLDVDDDGPGIAPAERERVVERFTRGRDAAGEGSGLGLAIVAAIARAHGGQVTIGEAAQGGARVRLRLPRADGRPEARPQPEVGSQRP
ncbi:MAG: HAMP domain-containing sensor histidine kinase [Egibacteraceae bacterium]